MNHAAIYALFLACVSAFAFDEDTPTKTITSDGTASDSASAWTALKAKDENGWTLVLGAAGGSYTWSSNVDFTGYTTRTFTIRGASPSNRPTITLTSTCTIVGGGNGIYFTVKDIIWFSNTAGLDGLLSLEGTAGNVGANYRVTNCQFRNDGSGTARNIFCEEYGLIDNCTFLGDAENKVWVRNDGVGWTGTHTFGTTNTVVIEDCIFGNTSTTFSQAIDGDRGCRYIFRFNTLTNSNTEGHGYTSGAGNESLQVEVYGNQFKLQGTSGNGADWVMHTTRGGTGVIYSNTVSQAQGSTWGDFNFVHKHRAEQPEAHPAPHQPGQGLVSLNTLGTVPIYYWANTTHESPVNAVYGDAEGSTIINEDFFDGTPKPGYTALEYPHPLRSEDGGGETVGSITATGITVNGIKLQ